MSGGVPIPNMTNTAASGASSESGDNWLGGIYFGDYGESKRNLFLIIAALIMLVLLLVAMLVRVMS